jgi:type VI secretion system protein ImpK
MRDRIAQLVHPVLAHGLSLRARLERGERPDLEQEQAILKDLLLSDFESLRWAEFGGDAANRNLNEARAQGQTQSPDERQHGADHFLGIRYLLACWLDELFSNESPWGTRWNERKLEKELYGTNDRAWRFWDQAATARSRPGTDALEVAYLCVALGFRGKYRGDQQRLRTWIDSAKRRLGQVDDATWKAAVDYRPPAAVPPLAGRRKLHRMALTAWVALLVLIPILSTWLVHKLGS